MKKMPDNFKAPAKETEKNIKKRTKKESRRVRSEIVAEKSKTLRPLKKKIKQIENSIEKREKESERLNKEIFKAYEDTGAERIGDLSKKKHDLNISTDSLYNELETLVEEFERRKKAFDDKMGLSGQL